MRSAECRMQSEKLNKGNAGDLTQRPQAGRPRDKGTAKTAVGGRRLGLGIREPGTRPDGQAGEQTKSNGTWNLEPETWNWRSCLTSSTAQHNLDLSRPGRLPAARTVGLCRKEGPK